MHGEAKEKSHSQLGPIVAGGKNPNQRLKANLQGQNDLTIASNEERGALHVQTDCIPLVA